MDSKRVSCGIREDMSLLSQIFKRTSLHHWKIILLVIAFLIVLIGSVFHFHEDGSFHDDCSVCSFVLHVHSRDRLAVAEIPSFFVVRQSVAFPEKIHLSRDITPYFPDRTSVV